MKKITKRDVLFFLAGLFAMLIIETIFDWDGTRKSFLKGLNDANGRMEQTK